MNVPSVLDEKVLPVTSAYTKQSSATAQAILEGLSAKEKHLPCWLLYDAAGSLLFEEITRLPEYYLTALEHDILSRHAAAIIAAAAGLSDDAFSVVELGAGSAGKTVVLLKALIARQKHALYLPVDVSQSALDLAAGNIHAAVPGIRVSPICSELTQEQSLHLPAEGRRLALYIGSSIGNFNPKEAIELLGWLRSQLQPGDALLLGTDMIKDRKPLLAAYNDKAGVTARFSKNILTRLNRELGADFSLDAFEHRAIWNPGEHRIEVYLDSKTNQMVHVDFLDRNFRFKRGESIHTENCYKFSPESVEDLLLQSGFVLEQSWYDDNRWFGVHLSRVVEAEAMTGDEEEAAA